MKVSVLESPVPIGPNPRVMGLHYDLDSLVIDFDPDTPDEPDLRLKIRFEFTTAFRCLDEGDLLRYWSERELVDHWLFRIDHGGWLTDEAQGHLNICLTHDCQEYLVCGSDDCITVLTTTPPTIEVAP